MIQAHERWIQKVQNKNKQEELDFLITKFDLLKDIFDPALKEVLKHSIQKRTFHYNQYLYKIGDPVKYIYFISKGQVEVRIAIKLVILE